MRVLSRIFGGFIVAVCVAFATVPAVAATDKATCLESGFAWDESNRQCCWHYYVKNAQETICINEDNFNNFFSQLNCGYAETALYIDGSGNPQCCPEGTEPNSKTHQCDCSNGARLDTVTGQCLLYALKRSAFCDDWNKETNDTYGFFFNYLIKDSLGKLNQYRSAHTCSALMNQMTQIGLPNVVTGVENSCLCKCEDPMLSFNPSAAEQCADGTVSECQNVCVDSSEGKNYACPLGQQKYLVDDEWTCCIFYDPITGRCITSANEWISYIGSLGFESGGGYVNAEGLPVECPTKTDPTVGVNRETGQCICLEGGWFDVTTGTCMQQLNVRHTWRRGAGGILTYNYTQTGTGFPVSQTVNGYLDTFFHQAYNSNGTYVYTPLPANTPANTPYVYTTTSPSFPGQVETFYYVTLTFMGNGGTFTGGGTSATVNLRVGAYNANEPTPTRSGYTFNGWWTAANGGTQVTSANLTDVTTDTVYYAHWTQSTPTTSTITLNKNGGTGTCGGVSGTSAGTLTCTIGGTCTLPSWNSSTCNLTKSGNKIFVGWTTTVPANHTSSTTGTTGSISSPASNTTYYAVWKDTTCDITNGSGSATTPSNNAPRCVVTCNTGYQTSDTYTGSANNPTLSYTCSKNCYKFAVDNTTNGGNNSNGATTEFWMYLNTGTYNAKNCNIYPSANDCNNGTNVMNSIVLPNAPTNASWNGLYSTTGQYANTPVDEGWFFSTGAQNIAPDYNHCSNLTNTQGYYNTLVSSFGFQANSTPSITLRTLYACNSGYHMDNGVCVLDTVTVSYDANGGSGSHALSTTCTNGQSCALQTWNDNPQNPCNITNGNKIFVGWSTNPNATTATYTTSGTFTSDTLLYAVWVTPTCSVTNGTGAITTPLNNAPQCIVTCNTGYQTSGTYTGNAGDTSISYSCGIGQYILTLTDTKETSNTRSLFEVYGNRWASNNGGTPSVNSITTVPGNTRTGYKFRGYYTSDLNDVTSNTSSTTGFKMKTNLTTINGCVGTNCTETLTSDTEWFAAWAQDCEITNGTCSVTIGTSGQVTYSAECNEGYTLSNDTTSRPICTPNSYTVIFDANGGSGSPSEGEVTCAYDEECPPFAGQGTLSKTNYTFGGWNTETDGSGTTYAEGATPTNLTTTDGATITVYAIWLTSGCPAGQYLSDGVCVNCPAGQYCSGGSATPITCAVNTYSTGGAASCSSCTGGLTTSNVADTRYHDEAADCGRVLHVGAYEIRLKSIPSTGTLSSLVPSPSLRFNYARNANGRPDFYANMSTIASPMRVTATGAISTAGSGNKFKTQYNNTNYYVCDDVTCVTQ